MRGSLLSGITMLCLLALFGCDRNEVFEKVELPTNPVLALRAGWAVAETPYTPVVSAPRFDAPIEGYLRRGTIVEVLAKTNYSVAREGEEFHWYQVRAPGSEGWIYGAELILTSSREQAVNASEALVAQ